MNTSVDEGNSENMVRYKLLFQNSAGAEITSLDMSAKKQLDLFSFVKVMKTEGTDTVEVDKKEQEFTYTSSNTDVVTVSESGKVTVKSGSPAQTVDIVVTWTDGSDLESAAGKAKATFKININPLIEEIEIRKDVDTTGIVSVSDEGLLKAEKEGTTAVTVSSKDNPEIYDTITKIPIEKIVIENKRGGATWEINDTYTLKTTVIPENATDKTISYKTSDKNIAKVSQSGVITATGIGKATITAYAKENSSVLDTFEVNVYQTSFNIAKLGVNGTDKSNDASKINKILKYATQINEPITVIVPDGTYYISSTLRVYPKTNIILSDHAVIKRMQSAGGVHMLMNRTDSKGKEKGYTQCQDIYITGGTWDGNATGERDANCLYFGHAKNITITNTTIKNNSGAHLIEFAGVRNALVENVELYGYKMCRKAGYTASQADKEAIQLDYCSSVSAPAMKPYDGTACDNITIRNCNIHNYMAGIGTHTEGTKQSTNIKIQNNTFKSISNACINLRKFSNVTISNNTAKNCTTFVYASGSKGTIQNNKVTNGTSYKPVTSSGLRAKNGITISNGSNFTIKGNTFEKAKSNGICVWNKSTAVIQNNKIKSNKLYGIRTQGSTITLKKNSFSKNSQGIYDMYKDAKVKSSDDIRAYYIDIKKTYKYNGKAVKPKIKIKGLSKKYYKVSYKNYKKPGTATVTIKGKGKVKQTLKIKYKISR
ncbi:MAG: right-handed parallel beta-helix repeat-containing protein [Lachnospiraceae bacterium]|nr:right-handed parallel beta-helix repeat-containing protein [Lachnospiraceae bacterium]